MSLHCFVSTRKGLCDYVQSNGSWKLQGIHFNGIPVSLSYYDPLTQCLWAFLDHGHWGMKMQRSFDQGRSWEEVASPVYPEGYEVKEGKLAAVKYLWAAHHGGKIGSLWVGTEPGGLFQSEDNGDHWYLNEPLWKRPERPTNWFGGGREDPGIHSIILDPRDNDRIFIGISCAGVYESQDKGKNWIIRNNGLFAEFLPDPNAEVGHDPHLLIQNPAFPDVMWQQNHCGIFRSTDAGKSWTDISDKENGVYFGFAIACLESNPETAWVVPGLSDEKRVAVDHALFVARTDDGGQTWTHLRQGLPQDNCFDIVYRHGLANIQDQLMFGTTTGNLFYSNDGGEGWQTISNYLPMVYAVDLVEV